MTDKQVSELHGFSTWTRRVLILLVVSQLLLGAFSVVQNQRIDNRANETAQLARDNRALVIQIQRDRVRSILSSCRDQNARHDNTIRRLNVAVARARAEEVSPERLQRLQESRAVFVGLFDALAPRENCQDRVDSYVTRIEMR